MLYGLSLATMEKFGIEWKPVLAYTPMSNWEAERMVDTLKTFICWFMAFDGIS